MTKKGASGHGGQGEDGRGGDDGRGSEGGRGKLWVPGDDTSSDQEAEAVAGATSPEEQAAEYLELARRVQADFENYKKRMLREQTHVVERASERVVRQLLPVIDDMDRTLAASSAEEAPLAAEHLADAVRLVRDKLLAVLAKEGVAEIDPTGEPFDPNIAEAMMQIDRDDVDEHTVIEVYQKGYRMGERLLRPAKVVVSGRPEAG